MKKPTVEANGDFPPSVTYICDASIATCSKNRSMIVIAVRLLLQREHVYKIQIKLLNAENYSTTTLNSGCAMYKIIPKTENIFQQLSACSLSFHTTLGINYF